MLHPVDTQPVWTQQPDPATAHGDVTWGPGSCSILYDVNARLVQTEIPANPLDLQVVLQSRWGGEGEASLLSTPVLGLEVRWALSRMPRLALERVAVKVALLGWTVGPWVLVHIKIPAAMSSLPLQPLCSSVEWLHFKFLCGHTWRVRPEPQH